MERAKEGDRFIRPDSKKTYIVTKVVISGDWVILQEEEGDRQILTSQESLRTWISKNGGEKGGKQKEVIGDRFRFYFV